MVFELLDSITSAFESPTRKNIRQRNIKPINELQQGMKLLQQRKQVLNNLSHSPLMESMESASMKQYKGASDKLKQVSKDELDILKQLEADFNKNLSSYSQKYKTFMEGYYSASTVEKCKSDCLTKYPQGSSAWVLIDRPVLVDVILKVHM